MDSFVGLPGEKSHVNSGHPFNNIEISSRVKQASPRYSFFRVYRSNSRSRIGGDNPFVLTRMRLPAQSFLHSQTFHVRSRAHPTKNHCPNHTNISSPNPWSPSPLWSNHSWRKRLHERWSSTSHVGGGHFQQHLWVLPEDGATICETPWKSVNRASVLQTNVESSSTFLRWRTTFLLPSRS